MTSRKLPRNLTQYFVLVSIVIVLLAAVSVVSGFEGFLSFNVGTNGISLTVDGR
ncbi:MAG: hypothetical protein AAGE59_36055 [Cyanobacteria bacterium P01_F01_bin.86]